MRYRPCVLPAVTACLVLTASVAASAAPAGPRILAYEPLSMRVAPAETTRPDPHAAAALQFEFDAYGRRFAGELALNQRFAKWMTAGQRAYRGSLTGEPGSWVRLTGHGTDWHGLIWSGGELYVIAPGAQSSEALVPPLAHADGSIVFRLRDTLLDGPAASCALDADHLQPAPQPGDIVYGALARELESAVPGAASGGASRQIELSVLADSGYLEYAGSSRHASDEMLVRLNNVDGIYASQLGLELRITSLEVYDADTDPFTSTTVPESLLRELAQVRRRQPELRSSGLTHLFTGRDLSGDTVGVAYLDAICDPALAAAVTELRGRSAFYESLITAHEVGHNLGAPHDGEQGPCLTTPQTFLMAPRINGNDTFSSCSLAQIEPRLVAAECVSAVPAVDLAVTTGATPSRALVDADVTIPFQLTNLGGSAAMSVRALVSASGQALDIVHVTSSRGTCNSSTSFVVCDIGDVSADEPVGIEVTVRGAVAAQGFVTVAADSSNGDANADNDEAVAALSIENGVDLAISIATPPSVAVDTDFEVFVDIGNRGDVGATQVVLTTSLAADLSAVDAALPGGNCVVTPGAVRCEHAVLDAQRALTATVVLRAASAGTYAFQAGISADQLDVSPQDDIATATFTATGSQAAGASARGGGGGGRMSPVLLLALLGLAGRVRRSHESCRASG